MVLYALTSRAAAFRGCRGVWYIDNVAALMALIRGRSDAPDLERLAHLIHIALFSLRAWVYWEWVPSKSNWSDSFSRLGEADLECGQWLCAARFLFSVGGVVPSSSARHAGVPVPVEVLWGECIGKLNRDWFSAKPQPRKEILWLLAVCRPGCFTKVLPVSIHGFYSRQGEALRMEKVFRSSA